MPAFLTSALISKMVKTESQTQNAGNLSYNNHTNGETGEANNYLTNTNN